MARAEVEVRNPSGLHARPAAAFVKAAGGFGADVRVTNLSRDTAKSASAKSVLGVMGLAVSKGHRIALEAEGGDAEMAVTTLVELVEAGLGEVVEQGAAVERDHDRSSRGERRSIDSRTLPRRARRRS